MSRAHLTTYRVTSDVIDRCDVGHVPEGDGVSDDVVCLGHGAAAGVGGLGPEGAPDSGHEGETRGGGEHRAGDRRRRGGHGRGVRGWSDDRGGRDGEDRRGERRRVEDDGRSAAGAGEALGVVWAIEAA